VLLSFVLVQLRMVLQSGYPLATYGLTLRNARRHALEAVPWTLAFLAAATLLKWALLRIVPGWQGESVFAMPGFVGRDLLAAAVALAAHAALVPAQEFVGRGAIQ